MRKTTPDTPIEFLAGDWGRFNADYADSIYEVIRGALPIPGKTSTRPELRKAASDPTSGGRTFWREPITWEIK